MRMRKRVKNNKIITGRFRLIQENEREIKARQSQRDDATSFAWRRETGVQVGSTKK